jgi:LysR family glycine cleavage system transcriptional activator/LysR family transcriptional regulator of beta-lactamase
MNYIDLIAIARQTQLTYGLPNFRLGCKTMRRLPSLNGLRAFEAAGRHGSFTAAAKELNVTQTAVSRLVRLLESRLGFPLFRRHASSLELTEQGQTLLVGLTDAFDSIARLAESVAAMRAGPVLTIGVGPTLAVSWLIPRLASFYRSHPEVEVRMATGGATRPVRDDWTCTIRRDTDSLPGYVAETLFPSSVIAVCTPEIASSLRTPSDLSNATQIRVTNMPNDWPHWFEAAGVHDQISSAGEALFESNAMAMQAVLNGTGVALAQFPYVSDALAAGRLVSPFPIVASKRESWLLEYRPIRQDEPALIAFRNWLRREAEKQCQAEAALLSQSKTKSRAAVASGSRPDIPRGVQ